MKVYVSCPVSVPKHVLQDTIDKVKAEGATQVSYWDRDDPNFYLHRWIEDCDVMVVILPKNMFTISREYLPVGVKREINRAKGKGKKIILSYINSKKETNLYDTKILTHVEGLSGTTPALHNHSIKGLESKPSTFEPELAGSNGFDQNGRRSAVVTKPQYTYDRRILLLM